MKLLHILLLIMVLAVPLTMGVPAIADDGPVILHPCYLSGSIAVTGQQLTYATVTNGTDPGLIGRHIGIREILWRDPIVGDSPLLSDLTIRCLASCFGVNHLKITTKDVRCRGITLLEVTSDQGIFVYMPEPGEDKLKADTVVDDGVNGPVVIHTSCSIPIDIGDVFGAYTITDLVKIFGDDPEVIAVSIDIKPQSCPNPLNVKAKGVLPAAILGTEDFDVPQIDPASVRLMGVPPLRWAQEDVATPFEPSIGKEDALDCADEGPDGFLDLTLKFDRQEVIQAIEDDLGREVEDREVLVLTLSGNLLEEHGGTSIEGEDVVIILKKGQTAKKGKK